MLTELPGCPGLLLKASHGIHICPGEGHFPPASVENHGIFSSPLFLFFQKKELTQKDKVTAPGHTSGR